MVFISADWCSFCRLQSSKTFKKEQVATALTNYYCVELNAEHPEPIRFLNRTYGFVPAGVNSGTHELAKLLGSTNGQLSLPTTGFLNEQLQLVKREVGYLGAGYFLE